MLNYFFNIIFEVLLIKWSCLTKEYTVEVLKKLNIYIKIIRKY
jgi:hypothetical protein